MKVTQTLICLLDDEKTDELIIFSGTPNECWDFVAQQQRLGNNPIDENDLDDNYELKNKNKKRTNKYRDMDSMDYDDIFQDL